MICYRGGRYTEDDAKAVVVQMLNVVAFCHLQGVVHRDLKPENFLFTTTKEDAPMKLIDFGLSDFNRPDERLNDIVGSAYYVAPEVLHRSYSMEADMWSIGVITYILLCGSRPFWAQTESGIFRSVLRADPNFDDAPWPELPTAQDFVKRLLNKDYRKRMTAAQALSELINLTWMLVPPCTMYSMGLLEDSKDLAIVASNDCRYTMFRVLDVTGLGKKESGPLSINYCLDQIHEKSVEYFQICTLRLLQSLSKALREDELIYLHSQFKSLEPNKDGFVSLENFRTALRRNATDAMKEARVLDILNYMDQMSYRKMDFEEFCVATVSVYQLEALDSWEEVAGTAFEHFEQEGNRVISVEELAWVMNVIELRAGNEIGSYSPFDPW
ncbi:hypothetical protein ACLOJK_006275 [Asimina triloba]